MDTIDVQILASPNDKIYYLKALKEVGKGNLSGSVSSIIIRSEKGVDFCSLTDILLLFPKLKILKVHQSQCDSTLDDLLQMLEVLCLNEFHLEDTSSPFLEDIDQNVLFEKLPSNCKYNISKGEKNTIMHIDPSHDKFMNFSI